MGREKQEGEAPACPQAKARQHVQLAHVRPTLPATHTVGTEPPASRENPLSFSNKDYGFKRRLLFKSVTDSASVRLSWLPSSCRIADQIDLVMHQVKTDSISRRNDKKPKRLQSGTCQGVLLMVNVQCGTNQSVLQNSSEHSVVHFWYR